MRILYNTSIYLSKFVLEIVALFNPKIKLFTNGRKNVFHKIQTQIHTSDTTVWVHAASLGEFEQGRPVIENIKSNFPDIKILVTFFSPSGYEIRKNYELADCVSYLPLDSIYNAKKFLKLIQPSLAIFIKYEFWPNYLHQLQQQNIPTLLISGIFREKQSFFKPYGFWMKKHLQAFSHFFIQDTTSKELLNSIGYTNVTIAGDTRFDRVNKLLYPKTTLDFIEEFCGQSFIHVAGSTWQEDEELLVDYILNVADKEEKFIIAPHNIKKEGIEKLYNSLKDIAVLYSQKEGKELNTYKVFIIDTIGLLSTIYGYANSAYIGGGYTKSGVHNTLEAATYGLPIVIGPNFKKFKEVIDLVTLKGCISTHNKETLHSSLSNIYSDANLRESMSTITKNYVAENLGATEKITDFIKTIINV